MRNPVCCLAASRVQTVRGMRTMEMMKRFSLVASLMFAGAVGCSSDNDADNGVVNPTVEGQITTATTAGQTQGNSLASSAVTDLSGTTDQVAIARSAGIIHAINDGEIMEAMVVLNRSQNTTTGTGTGTSTFNDANAIAFANEMIADHQANNQAL